MGNVVFAAVVFALPKPNYADLAMVKTFHIVCFAMLIAIPIGFAVRRAIKVKPAGDIVYWAMCESVSLFGLIITLLIGPGVQLVAVAIALAALMIAFPRALTDQA